MNEQNKTIQDLKMEIETIKKSQRATDNTGDRNPRKEIRSHKHKHHQQNTRNRRDNQMARGKGKNISNRDQGYLASSEPSSPTTVNPGNSQHTRKVRL